MGFLLAHYMDLVTGLGIGGVVNDMYFFRQFTVYGLNLTLDCFVIESYIIPIFLNDSTVSLKYQCSVVVVLVVLVLLDNIL